MCAQCLYVFNPEHDMCLANGDVHYQPPASALRFAHSGVDAMRMLYGAGAAVIAADQLAAWLQAGGVADRVVPWGWDARLKAMLLQQGARPEWLLSDEQLACIRRLQHRATLLPLQPHATRVETEEGVAQLLAIHGDMVLKTPWSGAGRGLRWVREPLTAHDRAWLAKALAAQGCVIAEQRFVVQDDFALEFRIENGAPSLQGLSLFATASGVYRHNLLLPDDEIRRRVALPQVLERQIADWVSDQVAPCYEGPLGIDLFRTVDCRFVVSEMNLRHTMGMVAHRYLQLHPEAAGSTWSPTFTM